MTWYAVTLATRPDCASKAPLVHARKLDDVRSIVVMPGNWITIMPRALMATLATRWVEVTDRATLDRLAKLKLD